MSFVENIIRSVSRIGMLVGLALLIIIMLIIVVNVITRLFGIAILGAWETSGLLLVVPAGFSIVYATMEKSHVVINFVTSRIPQQIRKYFNIVTSLIFLGTAVLIIRATLKWLVEGASKGKTEVLQIPMLPFQSVWVFCFVLICFLLLFDLFRLIKNER